MKSAIAIGGWPSFSDGDTHTIRVEYSDLLCLDSVTLQLIYNSTNSNTDSAPPSMLQKIKPMASLESTTQSDHNTEKN
jgi:hypothetical protein